MARVVRAARDGAPSRQHRDQLFLSNPLMMKRSAKSCGVAVVGGGLVGSALAYGLARQGAQIAVLDEGDHEFRASLGTDTWLPK